MNFKLQESIDPKEAWLEQVRYNRQHLDGLPMVGGPGTSIAEAIDSTAALQLKNESKKPIIFYGWQYKEEDPVDIVPEEHDEESFQARKNRIVNDYNRLHNDNSNANRYAKESDFMFYVLYNKLDEAKKKKKHGIDSVNYNAGNVEHNLKMFNMMNNPAEAVDVNPVSGPFGSGLSEDINTFENKGNNNMLDNELRDYVLELVLAEYETGHVLVDDFDSFRSFKRIAADDGYRATRGMFDFYKECRALGPTGFYNEYKDELDFSEDFIAEFGEEDLGDDFEEVEESIITEESNMDKLRRLYPELNECGSAEVLEEDTLTEAPKWWEARKAKKAAEERQRAEDEAAKVNPAIARNRRMQATRARIDEFFAKLGQILTPAFSDQCEDCRFLVGNKWYDQEGYEKLVDPDILASILEENRIRYLKEDSRELKTLCNAIDTVIVTPEGKIIRRGLEDLSSDPINYIRGRTDLTDINPKMSSQIVKKSLLPAIETVIETSSSDESKFIFDDDHAPVSDTHSNADASQDSTTSLTREKEGDSNTSDDAPPAIVDNNDAARSDNNSSNDSNNADKDQANNNPSSTDATKEDSISDSDLKIPSETPANVTDTSDEQPATNWLNDNAVKYGVRAIVGNRKDKRLLIKNDTGHLIPVAPKDINLSNIDKVFVDKAGKVSLRTALEKVKSEYRDKKADIIKKAAIFGENYDDSMEYEDFLTEDVFDDYTDDLITQEEEIVEEPIVEDLDNNDCDITTITYNDVVSGLVDNVDDNMMDSMIEELNTLASVYGIRPEELVIVVDEYDDLNPAFLSKVTRTGNLSRYINKYRCGDQEFYADTRTPAYIYFKSMDDANSYCANCVEENI